MIYRDSPHDADLARGDLPDEEMTDEQWQDEQENIAWERYMDREES